LRRGSDLVGYSSTGSNAEDSSSGTDPLGSNHAGTVGAVNT